jgi:pilus assembly protein CpaE
LLRNISRLDVTLFNGLVTHHSSGVDLLPSPDTVDGRLSTSLDAVERAFMFLASVYDFVLIDSPHGVSDLNLATIDHCDILYLLATPDVPGLRDLSRYVDHLLQNKISPDKLKIVINRYSSSGAVSLDQIEKAIRQPISITIPNGFADLVHAMNTGNPVAPERKSEFSIQMKKWAAELVPSATPVVAEPKRKFSFWG